MSASPQWPQRVASDAGTRLTLRPATAADASQVARLAGQLGYPSTAAEIARRLERIAADPDADVLVAELDDGALAAWLYVYVLVEVTDDPRGEVGGLVVADGYRSQGIGRELLHAGERWIVGKGCRTVQVHSNVIRADAHRFYEREGYHTVKSQRVFRKSL